MENVIPEGIPLLYSDNMLVQNRDGIFTLFFMQNQNPVVISPEDLKFIKSVKSNCVAKILTGPYHLARNIKALEENFNKFLEAADLPAKDYREFLASLEEGETGSASGGDS